MDMGKEVIAIVMLLALASAGCTNIAGKAFDFNQDGVISGDEININAEDVKACCTYVNSDGEEKTCYLMKRFECSLCDEVCE